MPGLDPQTQYYFRANASNISGTGPYSNIDDATTENAIPSPLFRFLLDGTDPLTPINTPVTIFGPARLDLGAQQFDGVIDYFDASTFSPNLGLVGSGAFSIMVRVRTTSNMTEFALSGGSSEILNGGFHIRMNASGTMAYRSNGQDRATSSSTFNDGNWHTFTITSTGSGGTFILYVDGIQDSTGAMHTYNMIDQGDLWVAAAGSGGPPLWPDDLDDFYFENAVWTPAQILAAHNDTV